MNEMEVLPTEKAQAQAVLPEIAAKMHRISHDGFGYPQCGFFDTWPKALYAMTEAIVKDAEAVGQTCKKRREDACIHPQAHGCAGSRRMLYGELRSMGGQYPMRADAGRYPLM